MKKENNNNMIDDKLWMKSMMEAARKEPSENLSYRIMHQIETEQAMSRAKPKADIQKKILTFDLRIFGLMYLAFLFAGGYFYLQGGMEALLTASFLWTCISISSFFSFYFLITTIDNTRRKKQKSKPSASK